MSVINISNMRYLNKKEIGIRIEKIKDEEKIIDKKIDKNMNDIYDILRQMSGDLMTSSIIFLFMFFIFVLLFIMK